LAELPPSLMMRSITLSRGRRASQVRERRASRVRDLRGGERLGEGASGGVFVPEPPEPSCFLSSTFPAGERPRGLVGDAMVLATSLEL